MATTEEKQCSICGEYWPADREFFFADPSVKRGLRSCCKACWRESLASESRRIVAASRLPRATDAIAPLLTAGGFSGGLLP